MWNSPNQSPKGGKRYGLADVSALILPLDRLLDQSRSMNPADLLEERILKRLERDEFVFSLFEVLQLLLEENPAPPKGHTGIQEAIIAELLSQSFTIVSCELDEPEFGSLGRKAVWESIERLLIHRESDDPALPWILEDAGMKLTDSQPYLSDKMTHEIWEELLLGENFLWAEFLWDADWRMDFLMDLDPDSAKNVTEMAGLDLDVVQALPNSPSAAELRMAEYYILYVVWKNEARCDGEPSE